MGTRKTHPKPERPRTAFELGNTYVTRGVHGDVSVADVFRCLSRHSRCDWGDVCREDRRRNDEALVDGSRLFSAYQLADGRKLWVITEARDDAERRSHTTVLFPDEY
jgi:hypothetical protein